MGVTGRLFITPFLPPTKYHLPTEVTVVDDK